MFLVVFKQNRVIWHTPLHFGAQRIPSFFGASNLSFADFPRAKQISNSSGLPLLSPLACSAGQLRPERSSFPFYLSVLIQ